MGIILKIVNKITPVIQNRASITGEDFNQLLIEELKKECLGVDQNNQSTNETIFKNIVPREIDINNEK
ncbi:hypothetical protein I3900191A7_16020 [Clostridium baratii]|uniref:hypothetical protein n=1 Tax=Clostridium baratii TaxID=1561 RepID=UPI0036F1D75B